MVLGEGPEVLAPVEISRKAWRGLLEDQVLSVLKRVVEELDAEIQLLATGRRAVSDIRDGKIVDTSPETLSQKQVFRGRLSELISKLEAAGAPRI
jgi:hypothetical protein